MAARSMPIEDQLVLWEELSLLQEAFPYTEEGLIDFANYCVGSLIKGSPTINRVQADMLKWLFSGFKYRMIMAQRGQAKTTLTAIYSVFRLIHEPTYRILIFSAGGKMAKEIASWVIQIIYGLDILECMRPSRLDGDRASVEGFDILWVLKGADKSPSVKCLGVDSNAQGSRADLIIADDIESMKNARTAGGREILEELTKEFESICATGDIIYLGTPQSSDSIYNNMPSRGYQVRIWTGRYPTVDEIGNYGDLLAPMLMEDIKNNPDLQHGYGLTGNQGAPTCPEMFPDNILIEKELSMGSAKFQLQYMLNTSLSDEERYPLKLYNLVVADFDTHRAPVMPIWSKAEANKATEFPRFTNRRDDVMFWAAKGEVEFHDYNRSVMFIDPSGGGNNADEMAAVVLKLIGSTVYIVDICANLGGYEEENLMDLVMTAKNNKVNHVIIEKNFGNGAHASMLKPLFHKHYPVTIDSDWSSSQKELRIIDTIEPVLSRHQLIVCPSVIEKDAALIKRYPAEVQSTYSLFFQMAMITRERKCLRHDDRLDALAGALAYFAETLDFDTALIINRERERKQKEFLDEWRTRGGGGVASAFSHFGGKKGGVLNKGSGKKNRFK